MKLAFEVSISAIEGEWEEPTRIEAKSHTLAACKAFFDALDDDPDWQNRRIYIRSQVVRGDDLTEDIVFFILPKNRSVAQLLQRR